MLAELRLRLDAQTVVAEQHVAVDVDRAGPAQIRNRLCRSVGDHIRWFAFVDDDDLVDVDHLEQLCCEADNADVIWSLPRIVGRDDHGIVHYCNVDRLRKHNTIPVTTLVRREMFDRVGGFPVDAYDEDWQLWLNILDAGGRFRCVHKTTWTYRFHDTNRTYDHP